MLGDEGGKNPQREGTTTCTGISASTSSTKVTSGPASGGSDSGKGLREGRRGRPKEDNDVVLVGFAFMAKKIDSMSKVS